MLMSSAEIEPRVAVDGASLSMAFKRDTTKADIRIEVQSSTDLKRWRAVESELQSVRGTLEKRLATAPMKGTRGFMRLKVTLVE